MGTISIGSIGGSKVVRSILTVGERAGAMPEQCRSGSSSAMRTRWRSPGSSEGYERIGSSLPTIGCHRPEDLPGFHGAVSFHRSTMPAR